MIFPHAWASDLKILSNGKSCDELYEDMLESECASSVSKFLRGASLKLGVTLHTLDMDIAKKNDTDVLARMTGEVNFSPYVSLELSKAFLGSSNFGYSLDVTYVDTYALQQTITRSGKKRDVNLGSYVTDTGSAFQPAIFYVFGGRDKTPNRYLTFGLGATLGFSYIRGNSYLTDEISKVSASCFDAGTQFVGGSHRAIASIKANCKLISYDSYGFGVGGNLFFSGRWENWQADLSLANTQLDSHSYSFTPLTMSVTLAYVILL